MSTSIITTTTFTFATGIDVQAPTATSALPALSSVVDVNAGYVPDDTTTEEDIDACTLAAFPRCTWANRKRCGQHSAKHS